MKGTSIFLFFTLTAFFPESISGQTYAVEASNGQVVKINLSAQEFSKTLILSSSKYSLLLPYFLMMKDVRHLGKRLLEIRYDIDGGTGLLLTTTVLVSVLQNNHLVPSLIFTSGVQESLPDDLTKSCKVNPQLRQSGTGHYELHLTIHDRQISARDRRQN